MRDKKPTMVFVYNAKSDIANKIIDGMHKVLDPGSYNCNLCQITFGALTEKSGWKEFRDKSAYPMEFLYKDEFERTYASKFGHRFSFPIILLEGDEGLEVLVSPEELESLTSYIELIDILEKRQSDLF